MEVEPALKYPIKEESLWICVCRYATGSGGSHVHVVSPSLLGVPRRTTWEACWRARDGGENGAVLAPRMGVFTRQGQCGVNGHRMMPKDYPKLCQDSRMRNEDPVGSLLPPAPHLKARIKILIDLESFGDPYCLLILKVEVINKHRITKMCTSLALEYFLKRGQ